jgi:S-adenosylmethionine-diacylglycerol 3-amino-3-carboxypropyl transferase
MEVPVVSNFSMNHNLSERVNFDLLRYANCWEDADILLAGLSARDGSKILSIGSAGDNSFSLLLTNPECVVTVDINKIQLHLIELKKVCIENLPHEDTICFLGYRPCAMRRQYFHQLKDALSPSAKTYWEAHLGPIEAGIIHAGKFEKYLRLFSKKILPLIHSRKTVEALLSQKTAEKQEQFYHRTWNTWRWRMLFRIFFSRTLMGKLGRDPEFLKYVNGSVSDFVYEKAAAHLKSTFAQKNPILRYCLTGDFGTTLPNYLEKENFEKIKSNIHKLRLLEGYAEDAISEYGRFDYFNLSNIFEYMDEAQFQASAKALVSGTLPGGRIAYWNLMVPRKVSTLFPEKLVQLTELSKELTSRDHGFFYKEFVIDELK